MYRIFNLSRIVRPLMGTGLAASVVVAATPKVPSQEKTYAVRSVELSRADMRTLLYYRFQHLDPNEQKHFEQIKQLLVTDIDGTLVLHIYEIVLRKCINSPYCNDFLDYIVTTSIKPSDTAAYLIKWYTFDVKWKKIDAKAGMEKIKFLLNYGVNPNKDHRYKSLLPHLYNPANKTRDKIRNASMRVAGKSSFVEIACPDPDEKDLRSYDMTACRFFEALTGQLYTDKLSTSNEQQKSKYLEKILEEMK